ncbi:mechanosensitive ion channel family protein [Methylobrevis albus]|uniref:Mechanosensitive ion channel family protein n=1 Tax=Methylobrevis albus TaxID=2793297 RepID=A0A931I1G2_9HYPH|nr:mechanosensitive ion channel family protein [Methylobrevis albus]MBH0238470.1 mechanosensitive ion channel family protein [Methylobrevis albus]
METIEPILREIDSELGWLPGWAVSLVLFAVAVLLALLVHRIVFRLLTQLVAERDLFWRSLVARTGGPVRLAMVIVVLGAASTVAPLTGDQADWMRRLLQIAFIVLLGWIARTALHIWTTVYLRRFKLDAEDNLLARKHVTQSRILERVANFLIYVIAVAAVMMTFESVRQYGVSLLASAGAAGVVIGLALQSVLKNLFAGIQLAVTQPLRLDDALLVEGEWGNVEEITATYVVLRLWDWRRLVLPLSYFIEQPFQNWTREGSALIGTVMIYLDYDVPVADIRAEVERIASASPLWDRKVVAVQVTDFRESVMEVRILVSATTAPRTFDLRCIVREQLVEFLRAKYPAALPRTRIEVASLPEPVMRRAAGMKPARSGELAAAGQS